MDPNNVTPPPPNPTPPPPGMASQSPLNSPSATSGNRKKIMIIILSLAVIVMMIFGFMMTRGQQDLHANYVFRINDQNIPKEDFNSLYSHFSSDETSDSSQTLTYLENLYVENYVLREQYMQSGGTEISIKTLAGNVGSSNSGNSILNQLIAENTAMRQVVLPGLGIKSRSGEALILEQLKPIPAQSEQSSVNFIQNNLTRYANMLKTQELSEVKTSIGADPILKARSEVSFRSVQFDNMKATRPVMPGVDFMEAVFTTPMGSTSGTFEIPLEDRVSYGFVYITDAGDGEFQDYREWFEQQKSQLTITKNFTDFD